MHQPADAGENVTLREIETSVKELRDNEVVQGRKGNRIELDLDRRCKGLKRLEGMVEKNSQAMGMLTDAQGILTAAEKSYDGHSRLFHPRH